MPSRVSVDSTSNETNSLVKSEHWRIHLLASPKHGPGKSQEVIAGTSNGDTSTVILNQGSFQDSASDGEQSLEQKLTFLRAEMARHLSEQQEMSLRLGNFFSKLAPISGPIMAMERENIDSVVANNKTPGNEL